MEARIRGQDGAKRGAGFRMSTFNSSPMLSKHGPFRFRRHNYVYRATCPLSVKA